MLFFTGCSNDEVRKESNSNSNKISNSNVSSNSNNSEKKQRVVKEDIDKSKIGSNKVTLYLFYSSTCPHCHSEIEWLDKIKDKYDYLKIVKTEVNDNSKFYEKVVKEMNVNNYGVPLTIIGSDFVIGYSEDLGNQIINLVESYSTFKSCDSIDRIKNSKKLDECIDINKKG
jgi:thiol-disulfide isomerase/thioredoxin